MPVRVSERDIKSPSIRGPILPIYGMSDRIARRHTRKKGVNEVMVDMPASLGKIGVAIWKQDYLYDSQLISAATVVVFSGRSERPPGHLSMLLRQVLLR